MKLVLCKEEISCAFYINSVTMAGRVVTGVVVGGVGVVVVVVE